jgi:hypothetical protein
VNQQPAQVLTARRYAKLEALACRATADIPEADESTFGKGRWKSASQELVWLYERNRIAAEFQKKGIEAIDLKPISFAALFHGMILLAQDRDGYAHVPTHEDRKLYPSDCFRAIILNRQVLYAS